jgi:hypothetical protein
MQQVGPNYAYYPDQSQSAPSQHAFQASRDRIDYLRPGRDFHAAYPSERSHLDGRFYADSSRPAYASEAPSHASENFPARFSNTRSPGIGAPVISHYCERPTSQRYNLDSHCCSSDHDLSASIMAVGHRLREEVAYAFHFFFDIHFDSNVDSSHWTRSKAAAGTLRIEKCVCIN